MELFAAKVVDAVCLFFLTLISSLMLPLVFILLPICGRTDDHTQRTRSARVFALLNCFSGGVFMGTGLLHLYPEIHEALEKASWTRGFPVAGFLTACGFFLVLIVEQIVLDYKESFNIPVSHSESTDGPNNDLDQVRRRGGSVVGVRDCPPPTSNDGPSLDSSSSGSSIDSTLPLNPDLHSSFRSVLLFTALSLHSVFEGIAIGVQTDVDSVMQFSLAVGLHKCIIGFGLGLSLLRSRLSMMTTVQFIIIFSSASPIGISFVTGIEEFGRSALESVLNPILQGLACGTFFYVTFFEVLPHELNHGGDRLLKLLAILIGFSVICCVMFLDPDAAPNRGSCPHIT